MNGCLPGCKSPSTPYARSLVSAATREDAVQMQLRLLPLRCLVVDSQTEDIHTVCAAGSAQIGERIIGTVSVFSYPSLSLIERTSAHCRNHFPYIPGFLAFHIGPAIVEAYGNLRTLPDILLLPGHGIAHPTRFGLACHIGVALDIRCIGVARNLLTGNMENTNQNTTEIARITENGEQIGVALRTAPGRRPLFISPGHRTDMIQATEIVQGTILPGQRYPEPLADAHRFARKLMSDESTGVVSRRR